MKKWLLSVIGISLLASVLWTVPVLADVALPPGQPPSQSNRIKYPIAEEVVEEDEQNPEVVLLIVMLVLVGIVAIVWWMNSKSQRQE